MAKAKAAAPKEVGKPAAKKAKGKVTFLERVASWPVPADAAGLARPWKGMAVDERAHALLGCGYPRMLVAVDEPVAELTDFEEYKKLYDEALVIPRGVLLEFEAHHEVVRVPNERTAPA